MIRGSQEALAAGGFYDSVTGTRSPARSSTGTGATRGDYYLGSPLTEVVTENGLPAQWFERGMLIETPKV